MLEYLAAHTKEEKASFHMPGHKGSALFARLGYGEITADHDITEIPGADDLRHPEGIIKTLTDKYAALYGSTKAFISVNGSSAFIMAAIMTCVRPGHKLLAAADSHISVKNGAAIARAEIVYAAVDRLLMNGSGSVYDVLRAPGVVQREPEDISGMPGVLSKAEESSLGDMAVSSGFSMPGGVSADTVAKALDADPDIDAVILPSPNYFGIVSDIKVIAEEVHKRGKILIVDQAHGAHLKMFANAGYAGYAEKVPTPAEECGADIVIVSTHKTMASFTQTAVANLFGGHTGNGHGDTADDCSCGLVDVDAYEKNLLMLESTSPSYILMESLAVNADIMEKHGSELAASWRSDLDWFYENVKTIPAVRVLTRDFVRSTAGKDFRRAAGIDFDDSKIVIDFSGIMLDGKEAEEILMEKGIFTEFHAGTVVMCLTGIGNVRKDYELLLDVLAEMK